MIHIDDLVKGRLSGGEEPEKPGSWLTMRELLDRKMPTERPAGGGGWSRLARYATVVALLLTFSLGGYQMIQATKSEEKPGLQANGNPTDGTGVSAAHHTQDRTGNRSAAGNTASSTGTASASNDVIQHGLASDGTAISSDNKDNNNQHLTASQHPAAHPSSDHANGSGSARNGIAAGTATNAKEGRGPATGKDIVARSGMAHSTNHSTISTPDRQNNLTGRSAIAAATDNHSRPAAAHNDASMAHASGNNHTGTGSNGAKDLLPASGSAAGKKAGTSGHSNAGNTASSRQAQPSRMNPAEKNSKSNVAAAAVPAGKRIRGNATPPKVLPGASVSSGKSAAGKSTVVGIHNPDSSRFVLKKDTIQQINIAYHYFLDPNTGLATYKTDTLSRIKVIVDRTLLQEMVRSTDNDENVPAPSVPARRQRSSKERGISPHDVMKALPQASGSSNPNSPTAASASVPGIAAPDASPEELVPLSRYKVSSRKSGISWNPKEGFSNFIHNTREGLAQMRFYSGMIAGLNTSFGGGAGLSGFHLGLTGLLTFNDHWSIMAELKYFQRFNNGYTVQDNYQLGVSNPNAFNPDATFTNSSGTYNVYNWKRDSMDHYFKFSSLGSIELPISLRYAFNRLSVLAGVNVVYNFSVNVEGVDYRYPLGGKDTVRVENAQAYEASMINGQPAKVRYENFGSRLGMGYLLGLAYQVSPAINVDLRLTQTMFDNASSSDGGKKVFNALYKAPNLQISIGYRFSQQPHH